MRAERANRPTSAQSSVELSEDTRRPGRIQIRSARLRRYVGGDPGGLCVCIATDEIERGIDSGCVIKGGAGWFACAGDVRRIVVPGNVVPFCAQLSAHSNSSSRVNFVRLCCRSIALQHSMFMRPMLHWLSPKLRVTPANAPPKSTTRRNKDASRRIIAESTLEPTLNQRQGYFKRGAA